MRIEQKCVYVWFTVNSHGMIMMMMMMTRMMKLTWEASKLMSIAVVPWRIPREPSIKRSRPPFIIMIMIDMIMLIVYGGLDGDDDMLLKPSIKRSRPPLPSS